MADYSSAQRYSVSKPAPVTNTPVTYNNQNPYGTNYPPQLQPQPQPIVVNPTYTPAMVVAQPVPIVVNQVIPPPISVVAHTANSFPTVCPHCRSQINTNPIQSFNCSAFYCCCMTCYIFFWCYQNHQNKDPWFYDAIHKCPACGQTVTVYNAC